jgi:hypothetical protein
MSVKPELAFDVCWEVCRGAREVLETKRGISALNWKDTGKYLWRPDFRPLLNEWVADFALAGKSALGTGPRAWCCSGSTTWGLRSAPLSRRERVQVGQLDGANPPPLRQGASQPRHVPAKEILCFN